MKHQLEQAARVVADGGVVAYPTESCFGLGCDPLNLSAIKKILKLKQRHRSRGLILIADRFARLQPYLAPLPDSVHDRVMKSWPGPVTWLWPARPSVSRWLTGDHQTLAVRVTAFRPASLLCQLSAMALVSTSANRASRPALRSAAQVTREFGDDVDYIVDGSIGRAVAPSRIIDCISGMALRG